MATKANRYGTPILLPYTVATGQSIALGEIVVLTTETTISQATAATDEVWGIAHASRDGTWPATAGDVVDVALLGSPAIVPVLVGTTGVTAGQHLKAEADGATNATTGGGTGQCNTIGQATQTGVAADLVGVNISVASPTVGS